MLAALFQHDAVVHHEIHVFQASNVFEKLAGDGNAQDHFAMGRQIGESGCRE